MHVLDAKMEKIEGNMRKFQCHRVKFFTPQPSSINSLAFEPLLKLLAVGRSNNQVEIYDTETFCFVRRYFVPQPSTVETILWSNGQLLCAGLDGVLHQFDGSTSFPTVSCCCYFIFSL